MKILSKQFVHNHTLVQPPFLQDVPILISSPSSSVKQVIMKYIPFLKCNKMGDRMKQAKLENVHTHICLIIFDIDNFQMSQLVLAIPIHCFCLHTD